MPKKTASYSNPYGKAIVRVKPNVSVNHSRIRLIKKETGVVTSRCKSCKVLRFEFGNGIKTRMFNSSEQIKHVKGCEFFSN